MKKICVLTGSRAEYGLLSGLMAAIKSDSDMMLQVIATNMHLSPEFGFTYKDIENDGFHIDKKVQMLLSSDTENATAKSVGLAIIGFADAYEDLQPDLIVVLGDRYEILAAVSAALFYKIPVAHLHGGEITEGAYDDSIRHAITKMSHLHFTSTEEYRKRVIQLGEQPDNVFNVGAIGVENIMNTTFLSKEELEKSLNFALGDKSLLVTFHPVTLEHETAERQTRNLLDALNTVIGDYRIIFTLPNSDTGSSVIAKMINRFVEENKTHSVAFVSLGKVRYLSALNYVSAVIGNSSSGIIEVPSFGIPTLNIGDRQKGRIKGESVVDCGTDKEDVLAGFRAMFSEEIMKTVKNKENPYYKANTVGSIIQVLKTFSFKDLIIKTFYDT